MGKIVAAPNGSASGIIPGIILALQEEKSYSDKQLLGALLTAEVCFLFDKIEKFFFI